MKIKHSKGLTLAELLLAAAILSSVLCGLLLLFINCSVLNESNRNQTAAITHAQYVMEEIRDSDFSGLEAAINSAGWDWNEADIGAHNLALLTNESIDTNVFQSGNPLGVRVRVDWSDRNGRARVAELETLFTDY